MNLIMSKTQIELMVNIIQSDIDYSEVGQPDYTDAEEMRYYADRADLMEFLGGELVKLYKGAAR